MFKQGVRGGMASFDRRQRANVRRNARNSALSTTSATSTTLSPETIDRARRVLEKHDALDLADMLLCPTNS